MAVETGGEWPAWVQNMASALGAMVTTLGVAHLNKRATAEKAKADATVSLQQTIDERIRLILSDDEKTINRLSKKIDDLERYVRELIAALIKAGVDFPAMPHEDAGEIQ